MTKQSTVAVITATTGSALLEDACRSIDRQSYPEVDHYLFYDGVIDYDRFDKEVERWRSPRRHLAYWPGKIGGPGLEGRRIYAAAPSLVNADYVCFLNEDDWWLPNHIQSLVSIIEEFKLDWAHSLRLIYSKEGDLLCRDDCESLGVFPIWNNDQSHLVETCSYLMKTSVAIPVCSAAYNFRDFGPDRIHYAILSKNWPRFMCSGLYTMCFRLGGNPGSVTKEFFDAGNAVMKQRYPDRFPWAK